MIDINVAINAQAAKHYESEAEAIASTTSFRELASLLSQWFSRFNNGDARNNWHHACDEDMKDLYEETRVNFMRGFGPRPEVFSSHLLAIVTMAILNAQHATKTEREKYQELYYLALEHSQHIQCNEAEIGDLANWLQLLRNGTFFSSRENSDKEHGMILIGSVAAYASGYATQWSAWPSSSHLKRVTNQAKERIDDLLYRVRSRGKRPRA